MKLSFALVAYALLAAPVWSQTSSMAANINTKPVPESGFGPQWQEPGFEAESFTKVGTNWLFVGHTLLLGHELYRTDGTRGGTELVLDINPSGSSVPSEFLVVNDVLYFTADDGSHGNELWRSDGSAAGTYLVMDIKPGSEGSSIGGMCAMGGKFVFAADRGTEGIELWSSDGTQAGTDLLKDFNIGFLSGFPQHMTLDSAGTHVLFSARSKGIGEELWKTDGTTAGTLLVQNTVPGDKGAKPRDFFAWHGIMFFSAEIPGSGRELWLTDGTAAGTGMVRDIYPGSGSSSPLLGQAIAHKGFVYFTAASSGAGYELWRTNGALHGTKMVADINPGPSSSGPRALTAIGGYLYFGADGGSGIGYELYRLEKAGVSLVVDLFPGSENGLWQAEDGLQEVGGQLVFRGNDGVNGYELWISDGTAAGTKLVKDIFSGAGSGGPDEVVGIGGQQMLLTAWHPDVGRELWISDGTAAGTELVTDLDRAGTSGSANPGWFTSASGVDLLLIADDGLGPKTFWSWSAQDGANKRVDMEVFPTSRAYSGMAGGQFVSLFSGYAESEGYELWIMGSSPTNSKMLKAINPGELDSDPEDFMSDGKLIFFSAEDTSGRELWATDGTEAGTYLVKDIVPGSGDSDASPVGVLNGKCILAADVPGEGRVLMSSDGTEAGTQVLYDSSLGNKPNVSIIGSTPYRFGDKIVFAAKSIGKGFELWMTDGTTAGTEPFPEILPGPSGSSPGRFFEVNGKLLFSAMGTSGTFRLWSADPVLKTVQVIKDVTPTGWSAQVDGWAFFIGDHPLTGKELWKTDGTPGGTSLVIDLEPGKWSRDPKGLVAVNGGVYFIADNDEGEVTIFFSDGTAAGTKTMLAQQPSGLVTNPSPLFLIDGDLLFTAEDYAHGVELFRMQDVGPSFRGLPSYLGLGRLTSTTPRLGGPLTIECTGIPAGTVSLLGASAPVLAPTALLTLPGSTAWLDPNTVSLLGYFVGQSFSWNTTLPMDASLAGMRVTVQAYFAFGGSFPAATSNGLLLTLDF